MYIVYFLYANIVYFELHKLKKNNIRLMLLNEKWSMGMIQVNMGEASNAHIECRTENDWQFISNEQCICKRIRVLGM